MRFDTHHIHFMAHPCFGRGIATRKERYFKVLLGVRAFDQLFCRCIVSEMLGGINNKEKAAVMTSYCRPDVLFGTTVNPNAGLGESICHDHPEALRHGVIEVQMRPYNGGVFQWATF